MFHCLSYRLILSLKITCIITSVGLLIIGEGWTFLWSAYIMHTKNWSNLCLLTLYVLEDNHFLRNLLATYLKPEQWLYKSFSMAQRKTPTGRWRGKRQNNLFGSKGDCSQPCQTSSQCCSILAFRIWKDKTQCKGGSSSWFLCFISGGKKINWDPVTIFLLQFEG